MKILCPIGTIRLLTCNILKDDYLDILVLYIRRKVKNKRHIFEIFSHWLTSFPSETILQLIFFLRDTQNKTNDHFQIVWKLEKNISFGYFRLRNKRKLSKPVKTIKITIRKKFVTSNFVLKFKLKIDSKIIKATSF